MSLERELYLENLAIDMREERIHLDTARSGLSGTAGGMSLVKRAMRSVEEPVIEALEAWLAGEKAKRRRSNAYKFLANIPCRKLVYMTARQAVDALTRKEFTYRQFVEELASTVILAAGAELYAKRDSKEFKNLTRRLDWEQKTYIRRRKAEEAFQHECIELQATPQERLAIGATLTEIFCQHSGIIEVTTFWRSSARSTKVITVTDLGREWIKQAHAVNQVSSPYHLPMVVPPIPWTTLHDGGYLMPNLHPVDFLRTRERAIDKRIQEADLSRAMKAVNAIQETGWQINKQVYEVYLQCVGKGLAGCSSDSNYEIPEALPKDHPEYNSRQVARKEVFEARRANVSKKCVEKQKLTMAAILADDEVIYYPHNLDFRGRIYPAAGRGAINPQGDDSGKALIRFAEGKPLGEDGAAWLFIHAQNTWGNDKISLQARVEATQENLELYCLWASDPMTHTGWMQADKPFCFLATCFELLAYRQYGDAMKSHLPIALDGSCSGLQHFAGIMKDLGTAEAVNVVQVDAEKPADIYNAVALAVHEALLQVTDPEQSDVANYWLPLLSRTLVKQPVMTLSYGVTRTGMRDQIKDMCRKLADKGNMDYKQGTDNDHASYLAEQVYSVIGDVAQAAFHVMDWLGAAARAKANTATNLQDAAFSWITPIGVPVIQEYYEYDATKMWVFVEGREIKFTNRTDKVCVKKSKQKQGAAPNFVHSMDASHLMLTVNGCVDLGIDSFAMIHDSFATHACDTGILFEVLRTEFIKMYEEDWLIKIYEDLPEAAQLEVGPPPSRGTLDLSLVQDSEFFFS